MCLRQGKELRIALRDGRAALVVPPLGAPAPARRAARGASASAAAILHPTWDPPVIKHMDHQKYTIFQCMRLG